jgi:hypothetical protein
MALAGGVAAWACGPFFPNWLLGDDKLVLQGPTAAFDDEVRFLYPPSSVGPHAVLQAEGVADDPFSRTAAIDRQEVAEALRQAGVPPERQRALAATYGQVRDELLRRDLAAVAAAEAVEGSAGGSAPSSTPTPGAGTAAAPPPPLPPLPQVPAGLPAEFAGYLEGALAYRGGDDARARRAWQGVLALPVAQRRHRSTWAAFMLGKVALRAGQGGAAADADAAVGFFERTRELAAQGFGDRLGLAAASLGWEARAELRRKRFAQAIDLYAAQQRTGDPTAAVSLRLACRAALAAGGQALAAVARDGEARAAVTSFVLAQEIDSYAPLDGAPSPPRAVAWMAAVRAAGVTDAKGADRLAWAAYRAGDFALAASWVGRAADSPVSRWVRARLLLRQGKLAEAETLLAAIGTLPADQAIVTAEGEVPAHEVVAWIGDPYLATPARALGEAGAAALSRGEMETALDHFLRAGYWLDTAYLAERVLSLQELRAYVDRTWPARLAEGVAPDAQAPGGLATWSLQDAQEPPPASRLAVEIRYLLGRRLVREGNGAQLALAAQYLPPALRPALARLAAALAVGRDTARPAGDRAAALFEAACRTRYQGLDLQGTEIDPDWRVFAGEETLDDLVLERDRRRQNPHLPATAAEVARAQSNRVTPFKRFHYRYRAADLARAAADLLPAGAALRAGMLVTAGQWLALRDPAAAQPFYRSLIACCGATDLGRAAQRLRWLPKADTCDPATELPATPTGADDNH